MVPSVAQLSPMLSGELSALLLEECGADYLSEERMANLVAQIDLAKVGLCTYDRRVNAGYAFFRASQ